MLGDYDRLFVEVLLLAPRRVAPPRLTSATFVQSLPLLTRQQFREIVVTNSDGCVHWRYANASATRVLLQ